MKALTLTQPWATLVAIGAKKVETRSWSTTYRGPLAIHAAKSFPRYAREVCDQYYFSQALERRSLITLENNSKDLPRGMVLATCNLVDVVKIYADTNIPGKPELMFGDYSLGRYMWFLEDIKPLDKPIAAKGALSLWEWNENPVDQPIGEQNATK